MSKETKVVTLFDELVPGTGGVQRGTSFRVNGLLKQINLVSGALGGSAAFNVFTGPGMGTLNGVVLVRDVAAASGLAALSAVSLVAATIVSYEVVGGGGEFVQVQLIQGNTQRRVTVTAIVQVPQE